MEERRFERNMGELMTSKACTGELCEHLGLSMSMLWSASKTVCLCHRVHAMECKAEWDDSPFT